MKKLVAAAIALAMVVGGGVALASVVDWGLAQQSQTQANSKALYGVDAPLRFSSTASITQQEALDEPTALATLAKGLHARAVTAGVAAPNLDMISFWPNSTNPQWLIACNEGGESDPGLQRINIATGVAQTILTGTSDCDPTRLTPWGTILFGEEAGGGAEGGRVYELQDPIDTTGVTLDRATGTFSGGVGADNFAVRPALGRLSFEGFAIYGNGLVYYGDENRPSTGTAGGAYFKFVPTQDLARGTRHIDSLDDSPLASGSIYGLRLGLRSGGTDYGQGTQTGFGTWVPVCSGDACADVDLRAEAATLHLTGYYRPEDIDVDAKASAAGLVQFCGNNTGNEDEDQLYGETICVNDGTQVQALANAAVPQVQLFVEGNPAFAMPDNVAYQPGRGNWVIHEDAATEYLSPHNDDLWDCLPDGSDDNLQSDGCVRVGTLNDLTAEWTGGIFTNNGKRFFVSVQHNISGYGTILEITGWSG
jgi:secreted PhoX family phosphatase